MKRYLSGLISGVALTLLVGSLAVGALAISSQMTITVDPINIQVNGEVFQPKDAKGNEVPVFAYNGTTYAPLRALAEAYGLEVGYDKEQNMATVVDPEAEPSTTPTPDTTANVPDYSDWSEEEEAAYQEWKAKWSIKQNDNMDMFAEEVEWCGVLVNTRNTDLYWISYTEQVTSALYTGDWASAYSTAELRNQTEKYATRLSDELQQDTRNIFVSFDVHGDDVHKVLITVDGTKYQETVYDIWGLNP